MQDTRRPYVRKSRPRAKTFRLTEETAGQLERLAAVTGRTQTDVVEAAVAERAERLELQTRLAVAEARLAALEAEVAALRARGEQA